MCHSLQTCRLTRLINEHQVLCDRASGMRINYIILQGAAIVAAETRPLVGVAPTHALDAIAQVMKKAVQGKRSRGAATTAGSQISRPNRLSIPASAMAVIRGSTENRMPK